MLLFLLKLSWVGSDCMLLGYFAVSKMERNILGTVCLEFLRRFRYNSLIKRKIEGNFYTEVMTCTADLRQNEDVGKFM